MLPTRQVYHYSSPFYDFAPVHAESSQCGRTGASVKVGHFLMYVGMSGTEYDHITLCESEQQARSRVYLYMMLHSAALLPSTAAHTGVILLLE